MKSVSRKHLIICLVLGVAGDSDLFPGSGVARRRWGGNWIALDFRGVLFWIYIILISIHISLSSVAVLSFPKAGTLRIHLSSLVLAGALFVTGVALYGKLRRVAISNEYRAMMASCRPLMNAIELKKWWYFPDESQLS